MTTIKTRVYSSVNRQYDDTTFTPDNLAKAKAELLSHLSEHRTAVNAFIRQQYFADATAKHPTQAMNDTLASLAREGFTTEVINLYALVCKYFNGSLPTQKELENLDAFGLKKPAKAEKAKERGAKALIEKWENFVKRIKGKTDAKDYEQEEAKLIAFALLKLKEGIEKNEI